MPALLLLPEAEAYSVQSVASPLLTGAMLRLSVADAVVPALSRTSTMKVNEPAAVGVPETVPEEDRLSPLGNEPLNTDQVYGVVPPLAASVAV